MRKELEHYYIGNSYGGNQEWFTAPFMKLGGCGAETAIESSIYFTMHMGKSLCPFPIEELSITKYKEFGKIMRPYLEPRMSGIDRLDIYVEGYGKYLEDMGESEIKMKEFSGDNSADDAITVVRTQIDKGLPVPMLMLNHRDRRYKDYIWHWFIVNGYAEDVKAPPPGPFSGAGCEASNSVSPDGSERFYIKTVTYSEWDWFDFKDFWETGDGRTGGLIIYEKGAI